MFKTLITLTKGVYHTACTTGILIEQGAELLEESSKEAHIYTAQMLAIKKLELTKKYFKSFFSIIEKILEQDISDSLRTDVVSTKNSLENLEKYIKLLRTKVKNIENKGQKLSIEQSDAIAGTVNVIEKLEDFMIINTEDYTQLDRDLTKKEKREMYSLKENLDKYMSTLISL